MGDRWLEEHEEFKDISVFQGDDNCSIKGRNLDHKTLAFFLSLDIGIFNRHEGYQDHKDNSSEESPYNIKGICGSICRRSSSRRSFSFPVLRSEWSDSPVRMVVSRPQTPPLVDKDLFSLL